MRGLIGGVLIMFGTAVFDTDVTVNSEAAPAWVRVGYYSLGLTLAASYAIVDRVKDR